jgi:hypothetical protein
LSGCVEAVSAWSAFASEAGISANQTESIGAQHLLLR